MDFMMTSESGNQITSESNEYSSVFDPNENIHGGSMSFEEQDLEPFRKFCLAEEKLRQNPGNSSVIVEHCLEGDAFQEEELLQLLAVFVILLVGVIVRLALRKIGGVVNYTVVLLILGVGAGQLGFWYCSIFSKYLKVAYVKPEILLNTFLPLLIFESAFNINTHTFFRSGAQILVLALPGMLISTFFTALVCIPLFAAYRWDFVDSSLFGSIVSATDPVAVVAILRDLGASETLSVLIEGESLLNDGIAVLLFEIFQEILEDAETHRPEVAAVSAGAMTLRVFLKFLQIAIGGPVFGFIMGRITILWLSKVYNDTILEISITIASAYLTYFIGEEMLHVSGIMGVVVLGLCLKSNETCISAQTEKPLKHFWEMMGYLANTLLFFICGLIIGKRAFIQIQPIDGIYLICLYGALIAIRFVMLLILTPLLRRMGYGFEWKNSIIIGWGGLRGAVGLCLALEVYENPHFCHRLELGPKILFHTAGIVLLTLICNATTTKMLMRLLRMTEVSEGKKGEIDNVLKILGGIRCRMIEAFKKGHSLWTSSNWAIVKELTRVNHPFRKIMNAYYDRGINLKERHEIIYKLLVNPPQRDSKCGCITEDRAKYSARSSQRPLSAELLAEDPEMAEEARIRVLKSLKISFWHQYEQGLLSGQVVRILTEVVDNIEDSPWRMLGCVDLCKYWSPTTSHILLKIIFNINKNRPPSINPGQIRPTKNENSKKQKDSGKASSVFRTVTPCEYLLSRSWFQGLLDVVVLASVVFSGVEVAHEHWYFEECYEAKKAFLSIGIFFLAVFFIEMIMKLNVFGVRVYLKTAWHYLDLFVIGLSVGDVVVSSLDCHPHHLIFRCLGLLRGFRLLRIIILVDLPTRLHNFSKAKQLERIKMGYEMGKAFCVGVDHIRKLLPLMSYPHSRSIHLQRISRALEKEKRDVIRQLGTLQRDFPNITCAAKTRHAAIVVLNHMMTTVNELTHDGLLEDRESNVLEKELEKKKKLLLLNCPPSIPPAPPTLDNLDWFRQTNLGLKSPLLGYFKEKSVLLTFVPGDEIYGIGDPPKGIYLIVSGLVKIQYIPDDKIVSDRRRFGVIPNSELLSLLKFSERQCDLFGPGSVIGEVGFLKHQERAASVVCETFVTAYFFSAEVLEEASVRSRRTFVTYAGGDDFTLRVWTSWGSKVAAVLLQRLPYFDNWSKDKIEGYLERSVVPWISQLTVVQIPEYVSDAVVIEGYFQNYDTQEMYIAPCLIPFNCSRLFSKRNPVTMNRLLLISHEDIPSEIEHTFLRQATSSIIARSLGNVDGFMQSPTLPLKIKGERMDARTRRRSLAISAKKPIKGDESIIMEYPNLP